MLVIKLLFLLILLLSVLEIFWFVDFWSSSGFGGFVAGFFIVFYCDGISVVVAYIELLYIIAKIAMINGLLMFCFKCLKYFNDKSFI